LETQERKDRAAHKGQLVRKVLLVILVSLETQEPKALQVHKARRVLAPSEPLEPKALQVHKERSEHKGLLELAVTLDQMDLVFKVRKEPKDRAVQLDHVDRKVLLEPKEHWERKALALSEHKVPLDPRALLALLVYKDLKALKEQ
jgi:hypothetical protein